MISLATSLKPHAQRLSAADDLYLLDAEALPFVIDARAIRVASLNPLGREALPELLAYGVDATAERLAPRYGVPASVLRRDFRAFLDDLGRQQLLPGNGAAPGRSGRFAGPAIALLRRWGRFRLPGRGATEAALRPAVARLLRQAWLDLRVLGWAPALRAWVVRRNLEQPLPAAVAVELVDRLVREEAAGQWVCACACKERALVAAYCLERFFGLPAEIVIGLVAVPFQLHAWATCGGRALTDGPDRIAQFEPLVECTLAD